MRYFIELSVETTTGLHIGSHADGATDSLFRRIANGNLVLPGTSIAGAIRGHLTRLVPQLGDKVCYALTWGASEQACGCWVCHLMGDINPINLPDGRDVATSGRASRLLINDTIISVERTHVRDGVGIDRATRTASRQGQAKFDFETIPAGTKLTISMELEDASENDRALVALFLSEWKKGRIRVGGNTRRGLGAFKISNIIINELDIETNFDDLFGFLVNHDHRRPASALLDQWANELRNLRTNARISVEPSHVVSSWLQIDYSMNFAGFFASNDEGTALFQGFNVVSSEMIAGSSMRGVLRSHAERIARTMTNLIVDSEEDFLRQCPAADPTAYVVRTNHANEREPDDKQSPVLESLRSRLLHPNNKNLRQYLNQNPNEIANYFDLADDLFGNTYQGSRLFVEDAHLIGNVVWKPLDFVAIDRFTGGAADKKKFDALALWQPRFTGRIYLESPHLWELGWLWMLLRDWHECLITFGYGASKGFGQVNDVAFDLKFGWANRPMSDALESISSDDEPFWTLSPTYDWDTLPTEFKQTCVRAWQKRVEDFEVKLPHTERDPFWSLDGLYTTEGNLK